MRIGAVIQARMGSSRLPGKVLMPIGNATMLQRVIERVAQVSQIARYTVATSRQSNDDILAVRCAIWRVQCYRGSHLDVLDRYYRAAALMGLSAVVRITADCPLLDPAVVSEVIRTFIVTGADYASNVHPASFPDGLDCEVIRMTALEQAWDEAREQFDREHVTPYIWRQPERFRIVNVSREPNLSHLRWTVDTNEDLMRVRELYSRYPLGSTDYTALLRG